MSNIKDFNDNYIKELGRCSLLSLFKRYNIKFTSVKDLPLLFSYIERDFRSKLVYDKELANSIIAGKQILDEDVTRLYFMQGFNVLGDALIPYVDISVDDVDNLYCVDYGVKHKSVLDKAKVQRIATSYRCELDIVEKEYFMTHKSVIDEIF